MAQTNAERQRAYRQRHLVDIDGTRARLNLIVEADAALALRRLAAHLRKTQAAVLRELLLEANTRTVAGMSTADWNGYHDVTA